MNHPNLYPLYVVEFIQLAWVFLENVKYLLASGWDRRERGRSRSVIISLMAAAPPNRTSVFHTIHDLQYIVY